MEKDFYIWLLKKRNLSDNSCKKYAAAVRNVSDSMIKLGVIEKSFYNIFSIEEYYDLISKVERNSEYKKKNEIGHNMYSVALRHFLSYVKYLTRNK